MSPAQVLVMSDELQLDEMDCLLCMLAGHEEVASPAPFVCGQGLPWLPTGHRTMSVLNFSDQHRFIPWQKPDCHIGVGSVSPPQVSRQYK